MGVSKIIGSKVDPQKDRIPYISGPQNRTPPIYRKSSIGMIGVSTKVQNGTIAGPSLKDGMNYTDGAT